MKKIKEINLNVDTSRYSSPYVKGRQVFTPGNPVGMRDSAASSYSSYMNSKKFDIDEEELSTEEENDLMPENILNLRVKNNKGYSLNETLNAIKNDEILKESAAGQMIQRFLTTALMSLLDDATGEVSGLIAVIPLLYKNIYELHSTNKKIEAEINSGNADEKKLTEYRSDLINDLRDILVAIVTALPIPGVDTVLNGVIVLLTDEMAGSATQLISDQFKKLSDRNPLAAKILYVLGYPLGGPVAFTAMKNIDLLSANKIKMTKNNTFMTDGSEDMSDVLDITPEVETITEMVHFRIYDILDESLKIESDYYGIDEKEELEEELEEIGGYTLPLGASNKSKKDRNDHHRISESVRALQIWKLKTTGRVR